MTRIHRARLDGHHLLAPPFHQRPPQNGVLTSRLTPRMPPPPPPPPPLLTTVAGASLGSSSSTRSYCLPPLEKQSIDRCPWTPHCRPPPPSRRLVLFFFKKRERKGRERETGGRHGTQDEPKQGEKEKETAVERLIFGRCWNRTEVPRRFRWKKRGGGPVKTRETDRVSGSGGV